MSAHETRSKKIIEYYRRSQTTYRNWGKDSERNGIYSLHLSLDESLDHADHYDAIKRMNIKMVDFAEIESGQVILDSGCGTGSISFEILDNFEDIKIFGINISPNQLSTAENYRNISGFQNIAFFQQDYLRTAFPENVFDRVLFMENFTHANDKFALFTEMSRVMKKSGKLIIFDVFSNKAIETPENQKYLTHLNEGFGLAGICALRQLKSISKQSGFGNVLVEDLSLRVTNSVSNLGNNAERRLREEGDVDDFILKSRLACIASRELFNNRAVNYLAIRATKI